MKKYIEGSIYYVRYPYKTLSFNESVIICSHYKIGKKAFVDVKDAEGNIIYDMSVKKLRKKGR